MTSDQAEVKKTIEHIAKASYGKLLAFLSVQFKDIQACEDALSESFQIAYEKWSLEGLPKNPEAWILTVAKNKMIDFFRSVEVRQKATSTVEMLIDESHDVSVAHELIDERLKLMFVCCHPSIDESVRTPLMLQTVLGLESAEIASAFLVSPSAMMKKLVRAKQKIKLAKIEFRVPGVGELEDRLEFVLEAVFAIYGMSWDNLSVSENSIKDLDSEAIHLAQVLVQLLPEASEPKGLLAMMLFCESRKQARRNSNGEFVPLDQQDIQKWDSGLILQAETLLREAFSQQKIGRFQLEAAIQSAHTARVSQKLNNWKEIVVLYNGLISKVDSLGARVSQAAAMIELHGAQLGLKYLNEILNEKVMSYQPYWVVKAHALEKLNQKLEAQNAYDRAIGLSEDIAVRKYLLDRKLALSFLR